MKLFFLWISLIFFKRKIKRNESDVHEARAGENVLNVWLATNCANDWCAQCAKAPARLYQRARFIRTIRKCGAKWCVIYSRQTHTHRLACNEFASFTCWVISNNNNNNLKILLFVQISHAIRCARRTHVKRNEEKRRQMWLETCGACAKIRSCKQQLRNLLSIKQ